MRVRQVAGLIVGNRYGWPRPGDTRAATEFLDRVDDVQRDIEAHCPSDVDMAQAKDVERDWLAVQPI